MFSAPLRHPELSCAGEKQGLIKFQLVVCRTPGSPRYSQLRIEKVEVASRTLLASSLHCLENYDSSRLLEICFCVLHNLEVAFNLHYRLGGHY